MKRECVNAVLKNKCFYCVTFAEVSLIVISFCLSVSLDVCRSFHDLQPTTIDRSQSNLVGRYIPVLGPCKPFWIPYLPYFRCQREKYAKFHLFPTCRQWNGSPLTRILVTVNVMHSAIWLVFTGCHFTKQLIRIITIQWRPGKCGLIHSLPGRLRKKFT